MKDDAEATNLLLPSQKCETQRNLSVIKSFIHTDLFPWIPARYVLVIIATLGFVNVYALRVNLSMAIVVMVNSSATHSTRLQYNWSSIQQGWVLSAFFIGYAITQIPGGYLAGRYGGRHVFGIGIVMTSVLTLLTPVACEIHIGVLIAVRVLEGLFEGVTFPAMHALLGKWSPAKERTIMASMVYTGTVIGNIVSLPLSAVLCEYGFAGGWPSVFYVFGGVGVVWYCFWLYLGYSSPTTHPRISDKEFKYIIETTHDIRNQREVRIPFFAILTSPAVWAIIIAAICSSWGDFILLTCMPMYFKDVFGLSYGNNVIKNGLFSAIPYVVCAVLKNLVGILADLLRKKGFSTVLVRKSLTVMACGYISGFFLGAASLLSVGYVGANKTVAVVFLTLAVSSNNAILNAGYFVNHIDLAPQYTGILMGITNTASTLSGIVAPIVTKIIAHKPPPGETNLSVYQSEWREVFIIAAEVYIFGALIYAILARGERQWWAITDHDKNHKTWQCVQIST